MFNLVDAISKLQELYKQLDKDTMKLFMGFVAKALGSGRPNEFIRFWLTKAVVPGKDQESEPDWGKTVETSGEPKP